MQSKVCGIDGKWMLLFFATRILVIGFFFEILIGMSSILQISKKSGIHSDLGESKKSGIHSRIWRHRDVDSSLVQCTLALCTNTAYIAPVTVYI